MQIEQDGQRWLFFIRCIALVVNKVKCYIEKKRKKTLTIKFSGSQRLADIVQFAQTRDLYTVCALN